MWIIVCVASFVYDLPIGRGKRFGGDLNRAIDGAIGGWQVNGIATFHEGISDHYHSG